MSTMVASKSAIIGNSLQANAGQSQNQYKHEARHVPKHRTSPMRYVKQQGHIVQLRGVRNLGKMFEDDRDAFHTSQTYKRGNVGGCGDCVGFARPSASIDQFGV